jgi:hypothetical protein
MAQRENLFQLPQPDLYDCYVERYQSNFQTLRLRVERFPEQPLPDRNIMEIVFTGCLYFRGALHWSGANIHIEPRQACAQVLLAEHLVNQNDSPEDIDDLLDSHHLYCIPTRDGGQIQFIASHSDYALTVIE